MRIILILFLFCSTLTFAQVPGSSDTLFNQVDGKGWKQGYWKGYYPNKKIKYTGFFKDNKPVGTFKRYYEDGTIKALMIYNSAGNKAFTTLYYQNGSKAAEGNFTGTVKDSTWNYFSYYDKTLSGRENFVMGKKEGISVSYYSSGKKSQELEYRNDIKNGIWRQYYSNGILKLATAYRNGKRNGNFIVNYPNDKPEWKGMYIDDIKDGKWIHYNPDGTLDIEIEFVKGVARNSQEMDDRESKFLEQFEKLKGSIPEPDENSVMPGLGM